MKVEVKILFYYNLYTTKNKNKIMDMKNTAILLMFLLCVLGLIVGVHYTSTSESTLNPDDYEETIHEDSNGTITIDLEEKENNSLDNFFT